VAARLGFLGVVLDPLKNRAGRQGRVEAIHARESAVEVWVVPADEGLAAAKEALALL
jgi:acetate kinase